MKSSLNSVSTCLKVVDTRRVASWKHRRSGHLDCRFSSVQTVRSSLQSFRAALRFAQHADHLDVLVLSERRCDSGRRRNQCHPGRCSRPTQGPRSEKARPAFADSDARLKTRAAVIVCGEYLPKLTKTAQFIYSADVKLSLW